MASFIPALIIKHNNTVYLDDNLVAYGDIQTIPTAGSGGRPDGDYWAVPITEGVVSGFNFVPTSPDSTDAPSVQSFHVFRLITSKAFGKADYWYVLGTTTDYIAASNAAECCSGEDPLPTEVTPLAPTQLLCQWNNPTDQEYFAVLAVPSLAFGDRIYGYGYFNNEALPDLAVGGYASASALVSALNSLWGATVGGTFVLADNGSTIILTQTAGPGTDELSVTLFSSVVSS